jgi:phage tail sheath protein FI
MAQYKTPNVYVRERSTLPPSVAEVATAIPVFVGYTEKTTDSKEESIVQKPMKITTMADYHAIFGGKAAEAFSVYMPLNKEAYIISSVEVAFDDVATNAAAAVMVATTAAVVKAGVDKTNADSNVVAAKAKEATAITGVTDAEAAIPVDEAAVKTAATAVMMATAKVEEAKATVVDAAAAVIAAAMADVTAKAEVDAVVAATAAAMVGATSAEIDAADAKKRIVEGLRLKDAARKLPQYMLAQSVEHFFANGGGACYIVSTGNYVATRTHTSTEADFNSALGAISAVDEITLLCLVDAHALEATPYYELQNKALQQCSELQDRFTLIDTIEGSDADLLSQQIADDAEDLRGTVIGDLKYGAAYYPNLLTSYARHYSDDKVHVYKEEVAGVLPAYIPLGSLEKGTATYNLVKKVLTKNYLTLPPTPAVAGMIAKVDGTRGVWKAPANVALSMVQMPSKTIKSSDQDSLNVDTTSGKSINAIRNFTGKGNLVWGARTLAGNDNEWRYISVRRLFNMVEESIQKATAFAVFEPNTPFTWLKLKTMMESYLTNLWKQGALFGDTPEQAFIVNVGLGQTMTEDDINNGIMNIEIGLAAVRPAEFIVLTFSHKSIEG